MMKPEVMQSSRGNGIGVVGVALSQTVGDVLGEIFLIRRELKVTQSHVVLAPLRLQLNIPSKSAIPSLVNGDINDRLHVLFNLP
jgi:hypothetical protein